MREKTSDVACDDRTCGEGCVVVYPPVDRITAVERGETEEDVSLVIVSRVTKGDRDRVWESGEVLSGIGGRRFREG